MTFSSFKTSVLVLLVALNSGLFTWSCSNCQSKETGLIRANATAKIALLRKSILAHYDSINSFEVTYLALDEANDRGSRHVIKKFGRTCHTENIHFGILPAELDLNHTVQLFNGKTLDVLNVNARYFETSLRNATLPYMWKVRIDFYVSAVGWWGKDDPAPPDELVHNFFRPVRFLLLDEEANFFQSAEENWFVIDRPKYDRTFLDPHLNYAVRKRLIYDRTTGKSIVRVTCSNFKKFRSSGTNFHWFPMALSVDVLEHDGVSASRPVVTVESLQLNKLTSEDFAFELPPGTIIHDRDTGDRFLLPEGRDLLDQNIEMAREFRQLLLEHRSSVVVGALQE